MKTYDFSQKRFQKTMLYVSILQNVEDQKIISESMQGVINFKTHRMIKGFTFQMKNWHTVLEFTFLEFGNLTVSVLTVCTNIHMGLK